MHPLEVFDLRLLYIPHPFIVTTTCICSPAHAACCVSTCRCHTPCIPMKINVRHVCVCVCVCMCVSVCMCVNICIHAYSHSHMYHSHTYSHTCTCTCTLSSVCVCICVWLSHLGPFHSTIGGSKTSASGTLLFLCQCDVV